MGLRGESQQRWHESHHQRNECRVWPFEVGCVKPSPAFYRACAEAAGRHPSACIFIDDLDENVEGARAAGLVGLPYRDPTALEEDLLRLGV